MEWEERPAVKLALIVEYDGTNYKGFQYQPKLPTIQSELEKAIGKVTGKEVRVRGASRTDTGVHALGQVVEFLTATQLPEETWTRALNFHLPWDVKVRETHKPPPHFHSRHDAIARTYRYTILNRDTPSPLLHRHCAWIRFPLDTEAMARSAKFLVGTHDFSAFTVSLPPGKSAVREVCRWEVWREEDRILIEAQANAFMMHQILRTNGVLLEVGRGKAPVSAVHKMMNNSIIKGKSFMGLPAKGLCLIRVDYQDFPPIKKELGI